MLIEYQVKINGTIVTPLFGDGLSKDYEKESDNQYFRVKLNGGLKLLNADFDLVNNAAFETKFEIVLYSRYNKTGVFDPEWYGYFYKTDCKFDIDNRTVEIKVNTDDDYVDVLSGMEKTFDLLKLATSKTKLFIDKRPLIQVYIPNDDIISCFLSGNTWEQVVVAPISNVTDLVNTYHFALASTITAVNVTQNGLGTVPSGVLGGYLGESAIEWVGDSNIYKIEREVYVNYSTVSLGHDKNTSDLYSIWLDNTSHGWILYSISGTTLYFKPYYHTGGLPPFNALTHLSGASHTTNITCGAVTNLGSFYTYSLKRVSDDAIIYYSKQSYAIAVTAGTIDMTADSYTNIATGNIDAVIESVPVYMRYLLDVDYIQGEATLDIPANDLVEDNRNYRKCIGYPVDLITLSNNTQVTPTEYGLNDEGLYYAEPAFGSPIYGKFYPIGKSRWNIFSIWFKFDDFDIYYETDGRKPYEFKEAIHIADAISILLDQISPSISHVASSSYSQFLYGTTNPIAGGMFRLFISQKSNITAGEFDKPAQKAEITLAKIFDMLKNVYQCYWFIDGTLLRIEHISWFKNGGSYSGTPLFTADLTTLYNSKNKKLWGFSSSKYEYEKESLPDRYEFSWADDCTLAFEGYPIKIVSRFIQEGLVESISVSDFTADIDYMLLNPIAINQDGFALITAVKGVNLFNIAATHNLGKVINSATGNLSVNATLNSTDYIAVKENIRYTFSNIWTLAWYDYDNVYISGSDLYLEPSLTKIAPSGACYVRISVFLADWTNLKIMLGSDINGTYITPYISWNVDRADLTIQNGLLSRLYLNDNYWAYDLPSENVLINEVAGTVYGVKRNKVQEVSYPSNYDPDPLKLIKTSLGNGQIEKISVNLASRMNKITLRYDTE